jgi:radical SAM family uncharacterized protein
MKSLLKQVERPGRYCGGEYGEVIKDKSKVKLRVAFCFPDVYEIGESNLGMKILMGCLNKDDDIWCERAFAPAEDMRNLMTQKGVKLSTLESGDALCDFDIICFTLQYELCYTTVLDMLKLAGIPIKSKDRGNNYPLIVAGGPCAYNPEPMADFIDLFSIGEGEDAIPHMAKEYLRFKTEGKSKEEYLLHICQSEGMYVPSLYDVEYNEDGTLKSVTPKFDFVPAKVRKTIIENMDSSFYPVCHEVPFVEVVHDRVVLEVFRGCIRGCRFCQAGFVYRPYRQRSPEVLDKYARESIEHTGYGEISLSALSISDYTELNSLLDKLLSWTEPKKINLSLPSMRLDSFYEDLLKKAMNVRQSGLTFAPEAGTQRLRDVINKNITMENILTSCEAAFDAGRNSMKLYFMNGLPTETDDDVLGIADVGEKILDAYFSKKRPVKGIQISMSVSCFVPKPFTPFQWEPQNSVDEFQRKQQLLKNAIRSRKISYKYHDAKTSAIEAVFARGNRKIGKALEIASEKGVRLDSWDEYFNYEQWLETFAEAGIDSAFFTERRIPFEEVLPWDHIDCGVTKEFLIREAKRAYGEETTPDCRSKCSACGHKCVSK